MSDAGKPHAAISELKDIFEINTPLQLTLRIGERSATFVSTVQSIQFDAIYVDLPKLDHIEKLVTEGRSLYMTLPMGDGNEKTIETKVIRYEEKLRRPGCWLKVPKQLPNIVVSSRRHVRVNMVFQVQITYFNTQTGENNTITEYAQNLSAGGLKIITHVLIPEGETVHVNFTPDKYSKPFKFECKVVFCQPRFLPHLLKPGDDETYTLAIEFQNLTRFDEDRLVGICFRKELERHKHSM